MSGAHLRTFLSEFAAEVEPNVSSRGKVWTMTTTEPKPYERPKLVVLLWRSLHEAAHALAVELLKVGEVGAVTISDEHGGVCFWQAHKEGLPVPDFRAMQTTLLWADETRSFFEKSFAVSIAGDVACAIYGPAFMPPGYKPPTATEVEREAMRQSLRDAGFGWLPDNGTPPAPPFGHKSDHEKAPGVGAPRSHGNET